MATVAPSPDKAANLLQNLSLDSNSKSVAGAESVNKNGPSFSNGTAKGMPKPFNPNQCYIPNAYPNTTYYYGGYDGQGDWNAYSRYMSLDGGMAQGVYGDSCSYMYPQGYGYTPYGAYAPTDSSTPFVHQHDGQLYGLQQYQYPSYYKSPSSADASFAPNKITTPQGEMSTAINADCVPSNAMNKGNTVSISNGDFTNQNGLNAFLTSSQHTSLNTSDSYHGTSMPAYASLSGGYQGPRTSNYGAHSAVPTNVSKHRANVGLSSQVAPVKDFTSQRNQRHAQSLSQYTNLNGSRYTSEMEEVSGFMNRMYPSSNMMFSRYGYGNTLGGNSRYGSSTYGYRTGFADNKFRATGNGYVNNSKRNMDGFSELNKGPRAGKSSDNKNIKSLGSVTLLLKGQNLPVKSDDNEVSLVPNKEQLNGENFSENYSDAKFFVIKSYSEDDIHKSIKYNVWASTRNGNKKLDATYLEAKEKPGGCPIFLLFSVNTSGQFVGLAEMVGPVDFDKSVEYWQQDRWTGCFPVKWHVIKDIPNSVLRHITLENNEDKPVTNSRDTQEVKFEKGTQVVKIFKEHSSKTSILDDFGFYEAREKATQERKSKDQQLPKQVDKASEITFGTVTLAKSLDAATLRNESATADATQGIVNAELEKNGSTPAFEDSSKSC